MKNATWNYMFTFVAVLFASSTASAATLLVPEQYATIQAAVNAAGANDVISIAPGTYPETVKIRNYDADGDGKFDNPGAGDEDRSGLQLIGRGTSPDDVIIRPVTAFPPQDRSRFAVITAYEPRGISDPTYTYNNGIELKLEFASTYAPGYVSASQNSTKTGSEYRPLLSAHLAANGGALDGVKIRNLSIENAYQGIITNGLITGLEVQNVKAKSGYMGVRARYGLTGAKFFNNSFENFKYGIWIEDSVRDSQFVDNTITLNNNMPQSWEDEGNSFMGFGVGSGATGADAPTNLLFQRNSIDFTAYTRARASRGMYVHGGSGHNIANNNMRGTTDAGSIPGPSWYINTGSSDINNWVMTDVFNGVYIQDPKGPVIDRNKFTNFLPDATNPWTTTGAGTTHWLPCDEAFGTQYGTRTFDVPATGTTTLSFDHWFSLSWGQIYLEVSTNGGATFTAIRKSNLNWYGGIDQYWGTIRVSEEPTRHPYGPDCSGWWDPSARIEPPKAPSGFNKPAPYFGKTTDGKLSESIDLSAYAGQTVTLRFRHDSGDKRCYECEILGSTDWCGWYFTNFKVANDGTPLTDANGASLDETTTGAVLNNWDITNFNTSAGLNVDLFGSNGGLTVQKNDFSNPHGSGIVFSGNAPFGTTIKVEGNNFENNRDAGITVSGSTTAPTSINAENNWWGEASGPTIASNPAGTGDAIIDPNDVVDFTPWTKPLAGQEVTNVVLPLQASARFSCPIGPWEQNIFILANGSPELIGSLTCGSTTTASTLTYTQFGTASSSGPVLLQLAAANPNNQPKTAVGDYVTVNVDGQNFRAYLPPNTNNLYGTNLLLYVDSDGTTFFACSSANRNCAVGSPQFQSFSAAKNNRDIAQGVGSLPFSLRTTAGSDFNWIGLPHFRAEVNRASELFTELNTQQGSNYVRTIAKWNPISQSYTQYSTVPFPLGNFDLGVGEAYRVEVSNNGSFALNGAEPALNSLSYTLRKTQGSSFNWFSLPWYKTDLVFASDLASDINGNNNTGNNVVVTISEWNPVSQQFTQFVSGFGVGNFAVGRGKAYRVETNATAVYSPNVMVP